MNPLIILLLFSPDTAQETLRVPKKRVCKYRHIIPMSSSSSSSLAASPTSPTVVCDDNLGGDTLSPSPMLSSEAVPETIQPKCRVLLNRLSASAVPRASSNLLVSPQMDPNPTLRTLRRKSRPCQNLMVYPLSKCATLRPSTMGLCMLLLVALGLLSRKDFWRKWHVGRNV